MKDTTFENVFKHLEWDNKGINVDGENLTNLRFADDIVLFSEDVGDMLAMTMDLQRESAKVGLKVNPTKTKIMTNISNVSSYHQPFEIVSEYV